MIVINCGGCGARFKVPDEKAGRRAKCSKCGAAMEIPGVAGVAGGSPVDTARPAAKAKPSTAGAASAAHFAESAQPSTSAPLSDAAPPSARREHADPADAEAVPPGRVMSVDSERKRRSVALLLLAAALLICFVTPVPGLYGKWTFPVIRDTFSERAPLAGRILGLFLPVAALFIGGITLLKMKPVQRGVIVSILGAIPILVMLITVIQALKNAPRSVKFTSSDTAAIAIMLLSIAAICGMGISSRVRYYRPASRVAYALGAFGAFAAACLLFLPMASITILTVRSGSFPLIAVIKQLFTGISPQTLLPFMALGSLATATVLAFVNLPSHAPASASRLAWATWLMVMTCIGSILVSGSLGREGAIETIHALAIATAILAVLPLGISEVMLGDGTSNRRRTA